MAILRNARIPALVLVARVVVELYNDATLAAGSALAEIMNRG